MKLVYSGGGDGRCIAYLVAIRIRRVSRSGGGQRRPLLLRLLSLMEHPKWDAANNQKHFKRPDADHAGDGMSPASLRLI